MTKGERIIALVILAIGAVYLATALSMPSMSIGDPLGHKAFPVVLGAGMIFLGFAILVKPDRQSQPVLSRKSIPVILVIAALLGCYGWCLDWTGYPLGTFLFLVTTVRILGEKSWLLNVPLSAGLSTGIYLLFVRLLDITLPLGIFERLKG